MTIDIWDYFKLSLSVIGKKKYDPRVSKSSYFFGTKHVIYHEKYNKIILPFSIIL